MDQIDLSLKIAVEKADELTYKDFKKNISLRENLYL